MQVGFIGAGNMARAPARGLGDPVLATDAGSGRAQELGGEAVEERGGVRAAFHAALDAVIDG